MFFGEQISFLRERTSHILDKYGLVEYAHRVPSLGDENAEQ